MQSLITKTMRLFKLLGVMAALVILCSCAATQVALEHKDLDTQTKMSETIFLDPVPNSQKTVYVQVKNTSNQKMNLTKPIISAIQSHGYKVVNNPNHAHYVLQANVLKIGKMSRSASQSAIGGGYGSALAGAGTGVALGALSNNSNAALAGGIVGGAIGFSADSLVKDVNYAMITDVQVSERTRGPIYQKTKSNLKQGTSAQTVQQYSEKTNFKRYRTRVVSNADKVNLKFAEARPALEQGLVQAISGIF